MVSIKKFVQEALTEIQESVPKKDFLIGNINFEITVSTSSKEKGGVDIQVLQVGAAKNNQISHKISFSVASKENSTHAMKQLENLLFMLKRLDQPKPRKKRRHAK